MEFNEGGGQNRKFDLEDRLLEFASAIIDLSEGLPNTRAGNHVAGQILRSGTAPYPYHGEAEDAESRDDFIHKLKICLKERGHEGVRAVAEVDRRVRRPVRVEQARDTVAGHMVEEFEITRDHDLAIHLLPDRIDRAVASRQVRGGEEARI